MNNMNNNMNEDFNTTMTGMDDMSGMDNFNDPNETPQQETWNPDMLGGSMQEDIFAAPAESKSNSGMILLAICILTLFGVFIYGKYDQPQEATEAEIAAEAQVDTALAKLMTMADKNKTKQLFNDTEEMVKAFYDYPVKQQVDVDELKKNPFLREVEKNEVKDEPKTNKSALLLEKELNRKVNLLKLQSVLQSTNGDKCLVNGEVYGIGQTIDGTFEIKAIYPKSIELSSQGFEFTLNL